jgi:hypothetical protein
MHHKDLEDLLHHHALRTIPAEGVFYLVAYDHGDADVEPEDAVADPIGFRQRNHADACASALACGNMPRVVLRCEPVARIPPRDPSPRKAEYAGMYRRTT